MNLSEHGHSTLTAMVVVLCLSFLFLSGAAFIHQGTQEVKSYTEEIQHYMEMRKVAEEVLLQLQGDTTPEAHSSYDAVWSTVKSHDGPYSIDFQDISSKLNPNWMRTKLFEETKLKNLIASGESPDQIRDRRIEMGFVTSLSMWKETFGEKNLNRFFTIYSDANINVTYEISLEELYRVRHGESGAAAFRDRIQKGLEEGKLWTTAELTEILGQEAEDLSPVINAEPIMNVHFVDPFLLECLLSYPYREDPLKNPKSIMQTILERRKIGELSFDELESIIQPNDNQRRVLEYLGVTTAFYSLSLSIDMYEHSFFYHYRDGEWALHERTLK